VSYFSNHRPPNMISEKKFRTCKQLVAQKIAKKCACLWRKNPREKKHRCKKNRRAQNFLIVSIFNSWNLKRCFLLNNYFRPKYFVCIMGRRRNGSLGFHSLAVWSFQGTVFKRIGLHQSWWSLAGRRQHSRYRQSNS
jgi:hypothetical protein